MCPANRAEAGVREQEWTVACRSMTCTRDPDSRRLRLISSTAGAAVLCLTLTECSGAWAAGIANTFAAAGHGLTCSDPVVRWRGPATAGPWAAGLNAIRQLSAAQEEVSLKGETGRRRGSAQAERCFVGQYTRPVFTESCVPLPEERHTACSAGMLLWCVLCCCLVFCAKWP